MGIKPTKTNMLAQTMNKAGPYDKIAISIAKEIGFDCYKQAEGEYAFKVKGCGIQSPPLTGISAGPNPCYEVPLEYYEIYVTINGNTLTLHKVLPYDLNDPNSIDKIKDEFTDLDRLRERIKKAEEIAFINRNGGEPGYLKLAQRARHNHYRKLNWTKRQNDAS